ncbi:hypothetical protein N0V93_009638 [Gnomoniopsis smithogilvyi]|uniref:SET domain-containing protein n=1 Tax=Gnomoniopsis smithogilvyi TaxID=1191159 RepID=A0A9W9CSW0_9PEZI|nr:hypothetical protein N0V93_009638 [Gnomoniopsis smithogilvyi]
MMEDSLEEVHEELLAWAEGLGVRLQGIRPMRLSGRGFGVVATDHVPRGTEVLTVPSSALRTKSTVPSAISQNLPKDMTVHGLLAADIALNVAANTKKYAKWDAVVPSWDDIQQSMPLTWPTSLQNMLPTPAKNKFDKQQKNFEKDWSIVSDKFPFPGKDGIKASCTRDEYLYAWMLVNTRTFYFVTPQTEKLPKADHMALQPVADLFNHTDTGGCAVTYDPEETYSFRTTKSYEKGEEVYISYGTHHNDFLLVEYGFVLDKNVWDEVCLDEALLPALSQQQKDDLEDVSFLGNYVLDKDTVCHRTQVALRSLLTGMRNGISIDQWREFVNGLDDGEKSRKRADAVLVSLLKDYSSEVSDKMEELKDLKFEVDAESLNESRRGLLLLRWEQIHQLVEDTIQRLS